MVVAVKLLETGLGSGALCVVSAAYDRTVRIWDGSPFGDAACLLVRFGTLAGRSVRPPGKPPLLPSLALLLRADWEATPLALPRVRMRAPKEPPPTPPVFPPQPL